MSAKQGGSINKIDTKRLCVYALLTAVCLVFGYIESLFPLVFIAPGVKVGLSNTVALLLAVRKDYKGAFLVNLSRILLSALLFGSAMSLLFALSAGIVSLLAVCLFSRFKGISAVGLSIMGAVVHNIVQCFIAVFFTGSAVLYYLPVLIGAGALCGAVTGIISLLILKKIKTK